MTKLILTRLMLLTVSVGSFSGVVSFTSAFQRVVFVCKGTDFDFEGTDNRYVPHCSEYQPLRGLTTGQIGSLDGQGVKNNLLQNPLASRTLICCVVADLTNLFI